MSIYAKPTSAEDYRNGIARRLEASKLTDDHLYYLMMSAHGIGPEAYLAPVYLKEQWGLVTFVTFETLVIIYLVIDNYFL